MPGREELGKGMLPTLTWERGRHALNNAGETEWGRVSSRWAAAAQKWLQLLPAFMVTSHSH